MRQGDIDNRHQASPDNAMQEGSRIHRTLQKRMGAEYQAEVFLRCTCPTEKYILTVEGRADGIVDSQDGVMIDEIKGTYRDLNKLRSPVPVHVAQAKCYAYMYGLQRACEDIRIRLTYCNIETEDIRYFYEDFTFPQLEAWFQDLIHAYRKWADYSWEWRQKKQASLESLEFPFPYREGQRDLVSYVYQTIYHQKKLFIEAPTGVGKTISTIFPALKAMGRGMGEKLFYLTAKTITRTVADDTICLLREQGLRFKSVVLTAKEKICFMEETECNPEACPYAKGHYDRINEAVYDLLTHEDHFSRAQIEHYARKHQVCPFEMTLDMSLFADGVICDYNYLFDPHVYLKRFFGEGAGGSYLFLIDEAHNLLERGREMYSASLIKEDFLKLKRRIQETIVEEQESHTVKRAWEEENQKALEAEVTEQMTLQMTGMSDMLSPPKMARKQGKRRSVGKSILVREGYAERLKYHLESCNKELLILKRECTDYRLVEKIDDFVNALLRLYSVLTDYLEEQEEERPSVTEELLDFYFEVAHFLDIYERVDEHYVRYTHLTEDGSFLLKLFCVNPRENLKECMARGRSTILFSATLLPIQYYKELLGGEPEDYEVYAKSVFSPEKRALFIARDVTSRYNRRSEEEYYNITRYIAEVVSCRQGNYMVFCPSYSFLQQIFRIYQEYFVGEEQECLMQQEYMNEREREEFLMRFRGNEDCDIQSSIAMDIEIEEEKTLIGFCVLGGIFSEGIDLKKDSLIGTIIVGTGLPLVCTEREILKNYFDEKGNNGFDYAYRYPGMNKVLQAAGRVIRTAEDVGVIALLDERFLQFAYRKMYPREWESFEEVTVDTIAGRVERFWDSWSKY
ncbi:MAG: ATP-dependent DNA helicase [Roseburia sp.]|nr:ATP-dependent DNA helicase [Roseburia sp.]